MSQAHWNSHTVRELERRSIREFVESCRPYLIGRVLDFGAGKPGTCREPQPYRDCVGGEYLPYDKGDEWPDGQFDGILCTQVLQYIKDPKNLLWIFNDYLRCGGHLIMTYPTSWDEVEACDLWRFTKAGMEHLLSSVGLSIVRHVRRAEIDLGGFQFPLGYGVVAQKECQS